MQSRFQSSHYGRYRSWLKAIQNTCTSKYQVLNELNHYSVVSPLRKLVNFEKTFSNVQLIDLWKDMMGAEKVNDDQIVLNNGVREGLSTLFGVYKNYRWAIPSNIYPVYSMLAESAGLSRSSIAEYDAVSVSVSRSSTSSSSSSSSALLEYISTGGINRHTGPEVLLITDPTPFGGELSSSDVGKLLRWVTSSKDVEGRRRIVIDAVYCESLRREFLCLIETNKVYFLHSLSKAHALPLHLGVVLTPAPAACAVGTDRPRVDNSGRVPAADSENGSRCRIQQELGRTLQSALAGEVNAKQAELRHAGFCMSTFPDMMTEQRALFRELWEDELITLRPLLADTCVSSVPVVNTEVATAVHPPLPLPLQPVPSYLQISNVPYVAALAQSLLAVPVSIYKSEFAEQLDAGTPVFNPGSAGGTIFSILNRLSSATAAASGSSGGENKFTQTMYHVTRCSNFARGFDKYSSTYDKGFIQESTFADRFYLLYLPELHVGVNKTAGSLYKDCSDGGTSGVPGDFPIVLQTKTKQGLHPSPSGVAQYISGSSVVVERVGVVMSEPSAARGAGWVGGDGPVVLGEGADVQVEWLTVEELFAKSMRLNDASLTPFTACVPRSVSLLPVAQGCQAKCSFCFSHSSISDDVRQRDRKLTMTRVYTVLDAAKAAGAERAVITGGGEPLVSPFALICKMVRACADRFPAVILISNGYAISQLEPPQRIRALCQLRDSGLTVLSISRHGTSEENNTQIMKLSTQAERIAESFYEFKDNASGTVDALAGLRLRWVCVLQKGGVDTPERLVEYLDWVVRTRVEEVCFKELYVSSTDESLYYDGASNQYSREHQVPLRMLTSFLGDRGAIKIGALPWGCPIYELLWADSVSGRSATLKIVAYTEPTVYWERLNRLCRSWNLMADGDCYSSLETNESLLSLD